MSLSLADVKQRSAAWLVRTAWKLCDRYTIQLQLSDKVAALRASVALPTADDWQLLSPSEEEVAAVIERANAVLLKVLARLKDREFPTLGDAGRALSTELQAIADDYPNSGLLDSEGMSTVALFFGVNYNPAVYDFFRYHPW